MHRWPHFLPGGTAALFTLSRTPGNYTSADIAVMDFERNVQKVVLPNAGMAPRYLPTGHLAYVSKGTLYVVPFDLERREVRGEAIPVLEGIAADPVFGAAQIDVSPGGTMVYRSGTTSGLRVLEWLDATGRTESMGLAPAFYQAPRVSPDGSRVAFELNRGSNLRHLGVRLAAGVAHETDGGLGNQERSCLESRWTVRGLPLRGSLVLGARRRGEPLPAPCGEPEADSNPRVVHAGRQAARLLRGLA